MLTSAQTSHRLLWGLPGRFVVGTTVLGRGGEMKLVSVAEVLACEAAATLLM